MPAATINGRCIHWTDEHYQGFWARVERGDWEPHTYASLDRHLRPDVTVIDAGAHIGAIALYAATIAKRVICLEPDPVSLARLRRNIAANPALVERIDVIPRALRPAPGTVTLGSSAAGGDSMSSTVFPHPKMAWTVETITPADVAAEAGGGPLFVKIDIEGGEYELVPVGQPLWDRSEVTVLLSTHPQILHAAGRGSTLRHQTRRVFRALDGFRRTLLTESRPGAARWALDRIGEHWPLLTTSVPRDWLFVRRVRRRPLVGQGLGA